MERIANIAHMPELILVSEADKDLQGGEDERANYA